MGHCGTSGDRAPGLMIITVAKAEEPLPLLVVGCVTTCARLSYRSPRPLTWGFAFRGWLGGEDSNPQ